MFFNQKKFERELEAIQQNNELQAEGLPELWRGLLSDLLIATGIAKTDDAGNIVYNDRGFPEIDWLKALFNIYKVVAYIVAMAKNR